MDDRSLKIVIQRVKDEQNQGHETRRDLYAKLRVKLGRPVVSFFTSFIFPVMIQDQDADIRRSLAKD